MEIRSVMEEMFQIHNMDEDEIDAMIQYFDRDKDGLLSLVDLKKAVKLMKQ